LSAIAARTGHCRRQGEQFVEIMPREGRYESQVLVGFHFTTERLWSKERPSVIAILPKMLRGRGANQ
jgi:hypothetical protein